ncbi:hypothetical protein [Dactylosporangium siamense]|uniref:hypothetical protein n=1 Tax=Dactylosporangium siamense TaxID=685454 RepID=UPI0031E886ED
MPQLPGFQVGAGALLYREPLEWIFCGVVVQPSRSADQFGLQQHVQLLAVPAQHIVGPFGERMRPPGGRGFWNTPSSVADAGPEMAEIVEAVKEQSIPYFDELGTTTGFQAAIEELARETPEDLHYQEAVFCTRLINGDAAGALDAAAAVAALAAHKDAEWARKAADRVSTAAGQLRTDPDAAIRTLRAHTETSRKHLRLPDPS